MIRIFLPFILVACIHAELVLTPEKAVELALKNNKQLKAAEWSLKEKEQGKKEAVTGFLPKVSGTAMYRKTSDVPSFGAGGGASSQPVDPMMQPFITALEEMFSSMEMGSTDNYSLGLNVSQPIFTGFKIINAHKLAKTANQAQKNEYEKNQQLIAYGAVSLFWLAYTFDEAVKLAADAEAQLKKLSEDQQKMFEAKMIAEQDLLQIKASYTKAKVESIRTERQKRGHYRNLINFLDLEPGTSIILQYDQNEKTETVAQNLKDYIDFVKKSRPDKQQSENTLEILALSEKMSKSNYYPTLAASFDYTYARPNQAVSFQDEWADSWSIMVIATWNLFDWGAAYRQGKQAEYRRMALKEINEAQERTIVSEAIDSWEAVEESQKEYDAAKEATQAADLNYKATKLKYEEGMVTTFEFLSAQSSLTSSQFSELGVLVKLKLALENMKIGGLGSSLASGQGQAVGTDQGMQPAQEQSGSMQAPSGQSGQMGSQGSGMSGMMGGQ
jgi:outer membrane protein TolC